MGNQPNAHRRLAAIMFTDMVGYSALTQRNEKLALELLDEHRAILRPLFPKYGGREIETAGDAFFVEFGSALDAAKCSIEIQKSLHDRNQAVPPDHSIRIRIGLHLGDVVFTNKNAHGDGVNIAARIEPLAEPGGICVSEDIARQIHNKLDHPVEKLGRGELKNIDLPMDIHRIVMPWEKSHRPRLERLAFLFKQKKSLLYGTSVAITLLAAGLYILIPLTTISRERNSIAVRPFTNIGGGAENEHFSIGITNAITGQLGQIEKLTVKSPGSFMLEKNREKSSFEIGNELKVAAILEGSVYQREGRVRIEAKLVDTQEPVYSWTKSYEKDYVQILRIIDEVALDIASELNAKLSPGEIHRLGKKALVNGKAYDLYLQGRYYWNMRYPDQITKGIKCFNLALAEDSAFALAYAGLADSYTLLGIYQIHPPDSIYPLAKTNAERALQIDPMLAEAHTSLAYTFLHYDRDWAGAEREFKLAIQLNPNYPTAYSWYAFYLTVRERFPEARTMMRKAAELDPRSPVVNADIGIDLYLMRRYDEAIEQCRKTLSLDTLFALARFPLGGAYLQKKMYREARNEFSNLLLATSAKLGQPHPLPMALTAYTYAVWGKTEDARMWLDLLKEQPETTYVAPYVMAVAYIGLGEKENALHWLEKAYRDQDASIVLLKVDPILDSLRSEPRFVALLSKMGFPPGGARPASRSAL